MIDEKDKQLDKEMDMTPDLDILKGDDGVKYFMTDRKDLPIEWFKKYVNKTKFLDVGSGDGRIMFLASFCGADVFGVEQNQNFIDQCKFSRRVKKENFLEIDYSKYNCLFYTIRSNVDSGVDFELIKKWNSFKGTLILYYRKTPHRLEKIEKALFSVGFTKTESIPHVNVYDKKEVK